jgi:hypothetical protein
MIYPNPDSAYMIAQKAYWEMPGGWLLSHIADPERMKQKLREAAQIAGLPFDNEKGIKLVGF